jgi:hypothetical protein
MGSSGTAFTELNELVRDAERELRRKIRGYLHGIRKKNEPTDVVDFHVWLTYLHGWTAYEGLGTRRSRALHGRVEKMLSDVEETFPRLRNARLGLPDPAAQQVAPRRIRKPAQLGRATADDATPSGRNTTPRPLTPSERRRRNQEIEQQVQQMFRGPASSWPDHTGGGWVRGGLPTLGRRHR